MVVFGAVGEEFEKAGFRGERGEGVCCVVGDAEHLGRFFKGPVVGRAEVAVEMGRRGDRKVVENAAAEIVRGDEDEGVGRGEEERERIEVVEARLVADEGEKRRGLGEACGCGDVAVDAGEAAVGEEAARVFREEKMVCVADGHAVAEKNGRVGRKEFGEGAVGRGFCRGRGGEMGGDDRIEFFVEGFPGGEPVGIGRRFEERAEFCGVCLDAPGESARWIEEVGIGADVYVGAILADPVERFFRGEPLAEVENQVGFEGAASFEEPVVMADLLGSGRAATASCS